jgi:DNA-binding transcriptional LysR family regulator
MPPLPPNLSRLGDDLQAAAERAIAARKARRAAFRRGLVVVIVAVTPAVLVMPGALAPFRPASIETLAPAGETVSDELAANEANVAVGTRFSSYRRSSRLAPLPVQMRLPAAMWNRTLGEPRARL